MATGMNWMDQRIGSVRLVLAIVLALVMPLHLARGQQPSQQAAASQPARKALTVPPGFRLTSMVGRSVVCESENVRWIQQTLLTLAPATRPSTMPVDLVKNL